MNVPMARLGGSPLTSSTSGYPWRDGDILYADDLNAALLPLNGGTITTGSVNVSGSITAATVNVSGSITVDTMHATAIYISDAVTTTTVDATNIQAANISATTGFNLPVSGGQIAASSTAVEFTMDSAGWRWEYVRSNGTLRWINGSSGHELLSIDSSGNLICRGTITANGLPVLVTIQELRDRVAALEARIATVSRP